MRVAVISEHASPLARTGGVDAGGQNVYVREVATNLAAAGLTVDVFTRRDSLDLPDVVEMGPGARVLHVPAGPPRMVPKEELSEYMPAFAEWTRQRVEAARCDIIHANFFMSGLVARDLKRWLGIPYVVTFHALGAVRTLHQGADDLFPANRVRMEQEVIDDADAVVAECPQDEADLMRWYDVPRSRIVTIPCGVDTEVFRPVGRSLARARRGWSEQEWIVLHIGRMVPRKGVDTVVEAVAKARERGLENVSLVVVGGQSEDPHDDQEVRRLMDLAEDLGIQPHVCFTGRVDHSELPQYYGAANVFVTTPWYEPFGITPLEAMACGLPVVGSNVGGIKYTVRDGETGFLVPPRDPDAVADRLEELHSLPWLASALAENARRRTEDLFTWKQVTDSVIGLYQEILDGADRASVATTSPMFAGAVDELSGILQRSSDMGDPLMRAGAAIADCLRRGGKVLVAGNGGSAAQSQHMACELMGRFLIEDRPALGVVALTADSAVMTAWSNDVGFAEVFARQVEGLGRPGDMLVGLSTSGNSANLIQAFETARQKGLGTVALLGGDGGRLVDLADVAVVVPSRNTQRIQEIHMLLIHLMSALVESALAISPQSRDEDAAQPVRASTGRVR